MLAKSRLEACALTPRLLSLHLESDFRVDAIAGDFAVVHRGRELLDVNGADIPKGLGSLLYDRLGSIFPALGRFG